ncbi:hypothetical protein E2C01_034156 [Portunus trituberculatus]|uniref:Uncharacterized protein n=1 Tax=Portunus trituberculatus TaxID=210409 RepID=A0A5B7F7S2_PORTR|nr:hypothetical protein [Portunus trituberculatus]
MAPELSEWCVQTVAAKVVTLKKSSGWCVAASSAEIEVPKCLLSKNNQVNTSLLHTKEGEVIRKDVG